MGRTVFFRRCNIHYCVPDTYLSMDVSMSFVNFWPDMSVKCILCSHSILQSLMQLSVHQFYLSTTCFGHIGPSSGTITSTIVAKAVSLYSCFSICATIHLLDALFCFVFLVAQVHPTNSSFVRT
jgi:hypothetical protein